MSGAHHEALKSAVGALRLKDIVLHEARLRRPTDMLRETTVRELIKRAVEFKRVPATATSPEGLRILVGLGIRYAAHSDDANAAIYLEIEADFVAEYEILHQLTEDAIKAFASFNAVHNVWPFWRQHVFDIVSRGRLRPIEVPLYSGNPIGGVAVSEAKTPDKPPTGGKKKRSVAKKV
jgi:hypothetical protein